MRMNTEANYRAHCHALQCGFDLTNAVAVSIRPEDIAPNALVGYVASIDYMHPENGKPVVFAGTQLTEAIITMLVMIGIDYVILKA